MHLRGLDMNLLVALHVLLRERSITKAGEELNLSQSGMSTALRRLRDFFDDQLLVPIGRSIVLTPLAESLVEPVQNIILQVKALIDYTPGFDPRTAERQFTVMASDYAATVFLATLLRYLKDAAPGVSVDIVSVEDQLHGPLERGEVDILIQPEQFLSPDHPAERLFEDEYVCIVWEGNSRFTDRISFDEYMSAHHVVTRYGKTRMLTVDSLYFRDLERQRTIDVVTMNFTLIPHFVFETDRVATIHSRLAKIFSRLYPLRILPVPFEIPRIIEGVQWHRYNDKHPGSIWLRECIVQQARNLGPPPGIPGANRSS